MTDGRDEWSMREAAFLMESPLVSVKQMEYQEDHDGVAVASRLTKQFRVGSIRSGWHVTLQHRSPTCHSECFAPLNDIPRA